MTFPRRTDPRRSNLVRLGGLTLAAALLATGAAATGLAAGKPKPTDPAAPAPAAGDAKYSIADVMKKGYKGKDKSLYSRVLSGKATKEDGQLLLELNTALAAGKPEKGDAEDWKKRTTALLEATQTVAKGDRAGLAPLKAAADCKGCHDLHRAE